MKQIKTRCKNSNFDYKWFGVSKCPAADKYSDFCDDYTVFSICVEISGKEWAVLFGKPQSTRSDVQKRGIRYYLHGAGVVGDNDAKFFYKLFRYMLADGGYKKKLEEIAKRFDERFTEEYLQAKYEASNQQTENEISDILDDCIKDIPLNLPHELPNESEERIFVSSSIKSTNHDNFLRMLNYLIKPQNNFDKIVLVYTSGNLSVSSVESLYNKLNPENNLCLIYMLTDDKNSSALDHVFTVKKKSQTKSPTILPGLESNRRSQNSSANSGKASSKLSEIIKTSTKSQNGIKDNLSGYLLPAMLVCGLLVGFGLGYVTSLILNNKSSHGKLNDKELRIQSDWKVKYEIEHKQLGDLSDDYIKLKSDYSEVKKAFEDLYHETIQIFKKFYKEYHESFDLDQTDDEVPKQTQNVKKKH